MTGAKAVGGALRAAVQKGTIAIAWKLTKGLPPERKNLTWRWLEVLVLEEVRGQNMWSNLFTRSLCFGFCCVVCLFFFVWGSFCLGFLHVCSPTHHASA